MKLGYNLNIEQLQKMVISTELIQAIQILQFNTHELEVYVEEQLLTNPVLEQGSSPTPETYDEKEAPQAQTIEDAPAKESSVENNDIDWAEHFKNSNGYDDISYRQGEYSKEKDEYTYEQFVTKEITLNEHLMFQLQFAPIKRSCRQLGCYIIESLDQNGYLTLSPEEIAKNFNVNIDEVNTVLSNIQTFDPSGVGAKDLKECLLIQLKNQNELTPDIEKIITKHIEDIADNRISIIAKSINLSTKEVQDICDMIKTLEPKPGRQFSSGDDTRYIIPDVVVEEVDGKYIVTVSETTSPKLCINTYYRRILREESKDSVLSKFLSDRLNAATWLIKSIEQRKQTIYNVVRAIVNYQEDFFKDGAKHLRTLTLKQIADEVGIHESTVSRAINGKYMQSPRGIFELKYFFSRGVPDNMGHNISSEGIKEYIKEIIDAEDPKSPVSDQQIVEILVGRGMDISRRTVAKYRGEMNLPSSSKRRRY